MESLSTLGTSIVRFAIDGLWIGTLVAVAARAIIAAFPKLSASQRGKIGFAALVAIFFLPIVVHAVSPIASVSMGEAPTAPDRPIPSPTKLTTNDTEEASPSMLRVWVIQDGRWTLPLASFLLLGAAIGWMRIGSGAVRIYKLRRDALDAPSWLVQRVVTLRRRAKLRRPLDVRISDSPGALFLVGGSRPTVLVSKRLVEELDRNDLDLLLMHEIGHAIRYDDVTRLLECLIRSVWFFHPAIFYVGDRLALDREMACDDFATQTDQRRAYARSLTRAAEISLFRGDVERSLAPAAFHSESDFSKRVRRLLRGERQVTSLQRIAATTTYVVTIGLALCSPRPILAASPSIEVDAPRQHLSYELELNEDRVTVDIDARQSAADGHVIDGTLLLRVVASGGEFVIRRTKAKSGTVTSTVEQDGEETSLDATHLDQLRRVVRMIERDVDATPVAWLVDWGIYDELVPPR